MSGRMQLCTFYLNDEWFGITIDRVREIIPPHTVTPVPLASAAVEGLINLRSQVITLYNLHRHLNVVQQPATAESMHLILHHDTGLIGLMVDRIGEIIKLDADLLEPPPPSLPQSLRALICGTWLMQDQLLLQLDSEQLAQIGAVNNNHGEGE